MANLTPEPTPLAPAPLASVGTLLSNAWSFYAKHLGTVLAIVLLPGAFLLLVIVVSTLGGLIGGATLTADGHPFAATGFIVIVAVAAAILFVAFQFWAQGAMLSLLAAGEERIGLGEAFRRGWDILLPLAVVGSLTGLAVWGGTVLFIVPGIFAGIALTFTLYVVVTEGKRGMDALRQSWGYISGRWWTVFGRILVFGAIGFLVAVAVEYIHRVIQSATLMVLLQVLLYLVLSPLATIYTFGLYQDIRAKTPNVSPGGGGFLVALSVIGILALIALIAFPFILLASLPRAFH